MKQPWNISQDVVPPGTEYMIVFRGGQGGNFLSTVLNIALDVDTPDTSIGHNEYSNVSNHILPVRNTHINLWFKQYHGQPYGTETYTVSRYRETLQLFRDKNLRIILLNADYDTMLRTELVATLKSYHRGELHPEFDLSSERSLQAIKTHRYISHFDGIIRHYNNLGDRLAPRNIDYLSVDYRDLFIDLNVSPLVDFANIQAERVPELKQSIADYTNRNRQLLNSVGVDFPA